MDVVAYYQSYFTTEEFERRWMFHALQQHYPITQVLYPGSSVHVTPSFYFRHVVYVDNYQRIKDFFADGYQIMQLINREKIYSEKAYYNFIASNYNHPLPLQDAAYDLLISQDAGFVSQPCKRYLKPGGILLVNNIHKDAGRAFWDEDYALEAVVSYRNKKYYITDKHLDAYRMPENSMKRSREYTGETGRGSSPEKTASSYIFRKVK